MDQRHFHCAFELKAVTDAGQVSGYGSVFGNVDQGGDVVEKGAFDTSLKARGMPVMLWGHDVFAPAIGVWEEAKEDRRGLFLKGVINLKSQTGAEVHEALKMGAISGLSIGYREQESDTDDQGVRHLKSVELFEVSFVNFPMNVEARVSSVKQRIEEGRMTKRDAEALLREAGFPRRWAKAILADGYAGLSPEREGIDRLIGELQKATATIRGEC